jgi:hypothetical protein
MTDGGVPGDLLAALLADHLGGGPLHEVLSGHRITGGGTMSRGSMRSLFGTVDVLKSGGLAYEDGAWRTGVRPRLSSLAFPGGSPVPAVRFPLVEVVTVPRHVRVAHVQGFAEAALAELFSDALPEEVIAAMPEGPDGDARSGERWTIVVEAATQDGRRAGALAEGPDTYGTTAVMAAEGTLALSGTPGVRAPAEVLKPAAFLDALAPDGITWKIL